MDIISHTFSGLAVGAALMPFSKKGLKSKLTILLLSGFAGFLPDVDAISYWSGFDSTFGNWFNLDFSGVKIYHDKRWFSHHGLFHSLLMAFILCGVIFLVSYLFHLKKMKQIVWREEMLVSISVFVAFNAHLLEDMITPEFVWDGVAYLFPSDDYWGGTGEIWWWNNYDLFLIIFLTFVLNVLASVTFKVFSLKWKWTGVGVFCIGAFLFIYQLKTRPVNFQYKGYSEHHEVWQTNERLSKAIQRQILGNDLYEFMEKIDNEIPFWF
tara:strand:+ start:1986 stop:2786 length:801 start_codon:yes stop_codon:yes gene_type:complete